MENESRKSEEQSRKLIRLKNQWFVSTESESDSDDSAMIRIRIDTSNTYSSIETWPDSWHSVSDHGHLSPAEKTFIGWGECEQDYFLAAKQPYKRQGLAFAEDFVEYFVEYFGRHF